MFRHIYFNPRSREGSDVFTKLDTDSDMISIHAPAKGATFILHPVTPTVGIISIHAPAKGATADYGVIEVISGISIHAPAKGATRESPQELPGAA